MFNKRKRAKRTPESRTAYLTTIDGAFTDDANDRQVVDGTLDNTSEDERYAQVRARGAHDAAGRAGGPKGSVRFGEGEAAQPRSFSMDASDNGAQPRGQSSQQPANGDMVDDIEQRIIDAAGSRGGNGADHEEKAIRARGSLIVAAVLAIILVIALAVCVSLALTEAAQAETQQTQASGAVAVSSGTDLQTTKKASSKREVTTSVPSLQTLIGATQNQAVSKLGHGAQVSEESDHVDEQSGSVRRITVVLTSETSSGGLSPTVSLDLNSDGAVVGASYRVAMASLGYGAISFKQAAGKAKVIQNTLSDAGVSIDDNTAVTLPKNQKSYSTYKSDGKTVVRQSKTFSGQATAAGMSYRWTGSLTYDYSKANKSGNLADTQRIVQVGITV